MVGFVDLGGTMKGERIAIMFGYVGAGLFIGGGLAIATLWVLTGWDLPVVGGCLAVIGGALFARVVYAGDTTTRGGVSGSPAEVVEQVPSKSATILRNDPEWFDMIEGENYCFGRGKEWTSASQGAVNANIFEFVGSLPDVIHCHGRAEETYWVQGDSGPVEMWLDGEIETLQPGERAIIHPGTYHATRPGYRTPCGVTPVHVVVVASEPFDLTDQHKYLEEPDEWYKPQ